MKKRTICALLVFTSLTNSSSLSTETPDIDLKIIGDVVNVRENPSTKAKIISSLKFGDMVKLLEVTKRIETIYETEAPWVRVLTPDGKTGFIFGSLVSAHTAKNLPSPYIEYSAKPKQYQTRKELIDTPKERRYSYERHWFTSEEYAVIAQSGFAVSRMDADPFIRVDDMIDRYAPHSYIRKTEEFIKASGEDYAPYHTLPLYITSDYILHCYHLVFDRMLEDIEEKKMYPLMKELSMNVYRILAAAHAAESDPRLKKIRYNAAAYAAVPAAIFSSPTDIYSNETSIDTSFIADRQIRTSVKAELGFIYSTRGPKKNAITEGRCDYSQFTVRGHYTHSPLLEAYFRAMTWYGQIFFPLQDHPLEGALVAEVLRDEKISKQWNSINNVLEKIIGRSDDLGPREYKSIAEKIFGANTTITTYPDDTSVKKYIASVAAESKSRIASSPLSMVDSSIEQAPIIIGFRFMGQRYIMDSRIFTLLTSPRVGDTGKPRTIPKGLDIFAAYGSSYAESLLSEDFSTVNKYRANFNRARKELRSRDKSSTTVYETWMDILGHLTATKEKVSQPFNETDKWKARKLLTAHGSWAELRHDTILYAKQSGEQGAASDGEESWMAGAPLIPRGYVEPDPDFYKKFSAMITLLRDSCAKENLLTEAYRKKTEELLDIVDRLSSIAQKEVDHQALTDDDSIYLGKINYTLARIILPAEADAYSMTEEEKQMALISDIHTDYNSGSILHIGVGAPQRIWIFVNDASGSRICEGYVYSYYEFTEKSRITDEAWKQEVYKRRGSIDLKSKEPFWINALPYTN